MIILTLSYRLNTLLIHWFLVDEFNSERYFRIDGPASTWHNNNRHKDKEHTAQPRRVWYTNKRSGRIKYGGSLDQAKYEK